MKCFKMEKEWSQSGFLKTEEDFFSREDEIGSREAKEEYFNLKSK